MFDFHLLFGEMIQFDKYSSNEFETINWGEESRVDSVDGMEDRKLSINGTRWAPTSYKWSYNPYKMAENTRVCLGLFHPYKWSYFTLQKKLVTGAHLVRNQVSDVGFNTLRIQWDWYP